MNSDIKKYLDFTYLLVGIRDLDKLMETILEKLRAILNADAGSIFIYDEDNDSLIFKYTQNDTVSVPFKEFAIDLDETSIAGYSGLNKEIVRIDDVYNISGFPFSFNSSFDKMSGYISRSIMAIPLVNPKDELIGVLQLINRKKSHASSPIRNFRQDVDVFSDEDEEISHSLSGIIAVALDNSLLYQNIENMWEGFIKASIQAVEARDPITRGHTERVTKLSLKFVMEMDRDENVFKEFRLDKDTYKMFKYACLLHDFGKIGVRESVLNKSKKLYPEQLDVIFWRMEAAKLQVPEEKDFFDYCISTIKSANEPTVLDSDTSGDLLSCAEKTFNHPKLGEVNVLTDTEYDSLSVKRGSLTKPEIKEIKSHVYYTYEYLTQIPWTKKLKDIPRIACMHHEKEDGSGYPFGLLTGDISVFGKVMAISDIFDALTAKDRPYKKAIPLDKALDILNDEAESGKLDKKLVDFFVNKGIYSALQEDTIENDFDS